MDDAQLAASIIASHLKLSTASSSADLNFLRSIVCRPQEPAPSIWTNLSLAMASKAANIAPESQQETRLPLTGLFVNNFELPARKLDAAWHYATSGFWQHHGDPRTSRLPLVSGGPWQLLAATMLYLYLVKRLLPKVMAGRQPLSLQWPIRSYNLLMVLSNLFAFCHAARILSFGRKCFGCEIIDPHDESPDKWELLHFGWLFFASRLVEWLDTVFFVLRKKEQQVTKLHVFHHSFVPLFCWTYLKFNPGYSVAFFPLLNSLVHTIMYSYYFLATFGPKLQPYLWWKRHLTSLQILQFVLILVQLASILLVGDPECRYPRGFLASAFAGAILFLWLFYSYYKDTYRSTRRLSVPKSASQSACRAAGQQSWNFGPEVTKRQPLEGSSESLWQCIENAIGGDDSTICVGGSKKRKPH